MMEQMETATPHAEDLSEDLFRLKPGSAHLWSLALDQMPKRSSALLPWVSEEERTKAERFQLAAQNRSFLGRRSLLRYLLSRYARCPAAAVIYTAGRNGKPKAAGGADGVQFSASSSGSRVLFAFMDRGDVGVDLEAVRWRPGLSEVALRYFNPVEQAQLAALPQRERQRQFFRIWTRKEAVAKLSGEGLAALDVRSLVQGQAWAQALPVAEGFEAHLALVEARTEVQLIHWAPNWPALLARQPPF